MSFTSPISNDPLLSEILADTWCCRSCSEIIGYLAPQPAPAACPNCRGSRLLPVLDYPRSRALALHPTMVAA